MSVEARSTEPKALVIGESLIDVSIRDGQRSELPGGSPMNVAVGLSRLGRPVDLATWYGRDQHGQLLETYLADNHVTLSGDAAGATRTSTATTTLVGDGQASFVFDLDWALSRVDVPANCAVVHTGSLAAALRPGVDVVRSTLKSARTASTITYDPNVRPDLMRDPAAARQTVESFVALADVVKASDRDMIHIGRGNDPQKMAAAWLNLGPKLVILTQGAGDVIAFASSGLQMRMPVSKVTVADTVGGGDAVMSALIDGLWGAGLLGADHREALGQIDAATLGPILNRSTASAAATLSREGANPPSAAELSRINV